MFSEDRPKGFGKFFDPDKKPKSDKTEPQSQQKQSADNKKTSDDENDLSKSFEKYPGEKQKQQQKEKDGFGFQYNFKFGDNKSKRPGDNNSGNERLFTTGMIGAGLLIAAASYYNYSYEEISWKDLTK